MDNLPHIFCGKCKGILIGEKTPPKVIAGIYYHPYCGGVVLKQKIEEDMKELERLIAERRERINRKEVIKS